MNMRLLIVGSVNSDMTSAIAKSRNIKVMMVNNIDDALAFLRDGKGADLVLLDVQFDIKSLVSSMKQEHIATQIVAYGINSSPAQAVAAIRAGAKEFLPLPPDEKLISAILQSISDDSRQIVSHSKAIQEVINTADKIAKSDAHVFITGQSGTGKEVLAHYIHHHSLRSANTFVKVNCAAIPENLLESELFGHEKGAFTGAVARRIGKFEESNHGTLLLDEISEMDVKLQAKLLRAIQEKEIDRVGGNITVPIDLRIIATSNRDLQQEVNAGRFREDLYFRLNIINLYLPKLSDRLEDIKDLSEIFIAKYSANNNIKQKPLSKQALDKMLKYHWPGNIRELENVIHRTVLLSSGDAIEESDISFNNQFIGKKISDVEKDLIINTMNYCLGDLNSAANILGISITSLKAKLDSYK